MSRGLTFSQITLFLSILALMISCAAAGVSASDDVSDALHGDHAIAHLSANEAVIEVTINPEARVSIKRTDAPLPTPQCGQSGAWIIRIVNQGFVTAGLTFHASTDSIKLEPVTPRLTGNEVEYRWLHFVMMEERLVDMTLTVDAGRATSDIGGRAQLPLLLLCR